jgi:outer membrane protein assembly complex protein YaeT
MVTDLLETPYGIMMFVRRPRPRHPWLVLPLALLAGGSLRAQYAPYEGKEVRNIQFDPVRQPLEADEMYQILPLKIGQPLSRAEVRASIERLFATGRYADIQVDAQEYGGGVIVRFLTKNAWFVGHVSAGGRVSAPPTEAQLDNAARLDLGQPFVESKLADAEADERRLLESNGLYHATVRPRLDWETGKDYQQVNIRFEVGSGARARFTTPAVTGDPQMDPLRILTATRFRRWLVHTWKPMTQERVRQGLDGVRKLYLEDHRLEARVTLESVEYDASSNRAQPTLHIDAGPRIQVGTVGAKVSQSKLRRYIPIFEEHSVDRDLLVEGARNLRDYFQSNGYYEAEVEFKEQNVVNDRASIDYLIHTGDRHKLVAIQIHGNRYFSDQQLRERMFLRPAYFLEFPHGRYSENLLRRDEDSIANLYRSNGFRDVKVSHRVVDNFGGRTGQIAVFLEIGEGPQQFIHSLTVEGIESLDQRTVLPALSSVTGQPFSEYGVAVDRDAILEKYFAAGFPGATFEWSSKPEKDDPSQVDLSYAVREGSRQFVREVIYNGNHITKPRLINRTLELNPGDPLSPTMITDTQRKLYDLGVFARVDAAIQDPDGETGRKYVLYDLEEARPYSVAVGVGAEIARIGGCNTCLDAPAGQTGFSPRISVNFSRTDLWGLAHSISLRLRASTLEQQALLNYNWPHFGNDSRLNFSITGLAENSKDIRTFSYRRAEGSLQLSQRFFKATTFFYRYTYRGVNIDESTLKITPYLIPLLSQPVRVGLLSWGLVQDHRDDPLEPHSGYYNTVDLGLAEHAFGSQRDFLRFLGRNASYYRLSRKFVLARSLEFGEIYAFHAGTDQLDAVPLPERFFGGGGSSNRGFPEEEAGPRDPETGFPIGGTVQLFNQTELRFPLIGENIGAVLFHDMGNTYSSLSNLSFRVHQRDLTDLDYMVHAVGVGLRYRTPVGPLRVDFAYGLNPPRFFGFKGTEQDLLNAGTSPCAAGGPYADLCTQTGVSHFQFFFSIGQTF